MSGDKNLTFITGMLLLKLLDGRDMHGDEMIEELSRQSNHTFTLKNSTLYPLLHIMEGEGFVTSWVEETDSRRPRIYYHLTKAGQGALKLKQESWNTYIGTINSVLKGDACPT